MKFSAEQRYQNIIEKDMLIKFYEWKDAKVQEFIGTLPPEDSEYEKAAGILKEA